METSAVNQNNDTNCTICDKTFVSNWHRDQHTSKIHNVSGIKCSMCTATFTSVNYLNKHMIVQHTNVLPKPKTNFPKPIVEHAEPKFKQPEIASLQFQVNMLKEQLRMSKEEAKSQHTKKGEIVKKIKEKDDLLHTKEAFIERLQRTIRKLEKSLYIQRGRLQMLKETMSKDINRREKDSQDRDHHARRSSHSNRKHHKYRR